MWGKSAQRAGGGVVQDDGDHRRFQRRRALDRQVDRGRGFGFDPVAKAAERPVGFQRRADGGDQVVETSVRNLENEIILGTKVFAEVTLDKKRLIKMKCYVGVRHKQNKKVHGQRTRTTGRKNKLLKGFQKNKKKVVKNAST